MSVRSSILMAALVALWIPHSAGAQETETERVTDILRAIQLPEATEVLRQQGVPAAEIEAAIQGARERDVSPDVMTGVFEESSQTVEEHGPIENFGAFVQQQLEAGLRGRELAEAIRAEHARRGIGKGNTLGPRGRGQGPPGGPPGPPGGMRDRGDTGDTMPRGPAARGQRGGPRGGPPDTTPGRGGGQGGGGAEDEGSGGGQR